MNDAAFLATLAGIVNVPEEQLSDATEIVAAEWDSVLLLDLISAIDESYGVTVSTNALNECRTVGELRALIRDAAAKA